MLFSFFDPINYTAKTIDENAKPIPMTDIFRNYKAYFKRVASNYRLRTYYIQGSPRPEELSYQIYGNPQLYWVLLMANDNYDPYYGWIISQEAAYQSSEQRYSNAGGNQVLYHVDRAGEKYYNLVESTKNPGTWYDKGDTQQEYIQYQGALAAVDTYEDAILTNEAKREIKIISPGDIDAFLRDLIREMEIA